MWPFIAQNAGTIMTVGGSIFVAAIGAYAMVRARKVSPGREPIPVKDIWEENRLTRHEADKVRDENIALDRQVLNQGNAIVVLWAYTTRLVESWGSPRMPTLTRSEQAIIDRVIEDTTLNNPTGEP